MIQNWSSSESNFERYVVVLREIRGLRIIQLTTQTYCEIPGDIVVMIGGGGGG